MGNIKGMGPCPIPQDNGLPCARQIQEGEPVGTITAGSAYNPQSATGHKRCADAWYSRKQQKERERNLAMVQRVNQSGPGGAVNFNEGYDAVKGSVPLDKEAARPAPGTVIGDMSQGAHFIGDIPEDATPADAVQYAKGEPIKAKPNFAEYLPPGVPLLPVDGPRLAPEEKANPNPPSQVKTAYQGYAQQILGDPMPKVDAVAGRVMLAEMAVRPDGTLHLDPEDAADFIELLRVNVGRARRQQL